MHIIFDNFFHALLQLTTIVCTFSIDNFCIDYYNCGLLYTAERHKSISYIGCNSKHKSIAALWLVQNILQSDMVTFRAAIAA